MFADISEVLYPVPGFEKFHAFEDGEHVVAMTQYADSRQCKMRCIVATNRNLYELIDDKLVRIKIEVIDA
jgi:hypothetical protein